MFQHTAARRRLDRCISSQVEILVFQHTAARRRLDAGYMPARMFHKVSTHSRPKAAGTLACRNPVASEFQHTAARRRLAGRWRDIRLPIQRFNTQPPEGGWLIPRGRPSPRRVSTHSRPKAAGVFMYDRALSDSVSTHSRPKAAGRHSRHVFGYAAGFNTQPPEGGWWCDALVRFASTKFQHTAARRRLAKPAAPAVIDSAFQHTAARRRLEIAGYRNVPFNVFQHTAARRRLGQCRLCMYCCRVFQHTAARRRLVIISLSQWRCMSFQHTAARRRLAQQHPRAGAIHRFNTQPPEGGWGLPSRELIAKTQVSTHSRPKAAGDLST